MNKYYIHFLTIFLFLNISLSAQTWNHMGTEHTNQLPNSIYINALLVWNNDLYVAGMVDSMGKSWTNIIKYNGLNWNVIGQTNGKFWGETIRCLALYNGSIIAGGYFNLIDEVPVNGIARWDGNQWHAMGTGVGGSAPHIEAIIVYNNTLYIGGTFTNCSGVAAAGIAMWNESAQKWYPVGTVPPVPRSAKVGIYSFAIYNNELYCGGTYDQDSAIIGRLENNIWMQVGGGIKGQGIVKSMVAYNNKLVVGGHFNRPGDSYIPNVAFWNGSNWSQFLTLDTNAWVYGMCVIGNLLYLSGNINSPSHHIVSYPNNQFINHTCNDQIWALTNYPVGSSNLVAAGWMTQVDTLHVKHIAMWGTPIITSLNENNKNINFVLEQNYPNPFNPVTNIKFTVPKKSFVKVEIYNGIGQQIDIISEKEYSPGEYNLVWNGINFPSGVYFCKFESENFRDVKKMLLIK
jgi:hypothetical protein